MDRQRLCGITVMTAFGLIALYMLYSGISGVIAVVRAGAAGAPTLVASSGDVIVVPGAIVVSIFAFMEIARPADPGLTRLAAVALGFFFLTVLVRLHFAMAVEPLLAQRGYANCPQSAGIDG